MNSRQASAQDGGPKVTIVSPIPLPVSGTVAATQSGAWVVNARTVDNPALNALQVVIPTLRNAIPEPLLTVPVGKELIIENVSLVVSLRPGDIIYSITLTSTVKGVQADHKLIPVFRVTGPFATGNPSDVYLVSQAFRLYADPGSVPTITLNCTCVTSDPQFLSDGAISGAFVNIQQPVPDCASVAVLTFVNDPLSQLSYYWVIKYIESITSRWSYPSENPIE
jgi:hypothetical protein